MSTLAFKAETIYAPPVVSAVECDPGFPSSAGSPCDTADENVYAVPSVGYEDKVLVRDLGCTATRSGNGVDAQFNCFTHDSMNWITDFPAPYVDTTFGDSGTFYVPAMGSRAPYSLNEGWDYSWRIEFYQWGQDPAGAYTFQHNAAVTTYWDVPLLGCTSTAPEFCYFNVKQRRIAPVVNL